MKTYQTEDKTEWGEGPWQDEPDKAVWVDEATNLDCMIHRNGVGALCGYVGVGPDHPAYGKHYDDVDVDVHGGLTYANTCRETATEDHGICHVPEPGREHDIWWLGFDCSHSGDLCPEMERRMSPSLAEWQTYKTFGYVKAEVERLAQQLEEK